MISKLSSVLVFTLAILTFLAEARTGDAVQVKLRYNLNFQASDSEVQDILKKADLESHGFIKEVSSRLVKEPGTNAAEYQESYFYYKEVNCSRTQEVEQELDTLIPGIFGDNVASKLNEETKSTNKMGQCRVGLELIFRKPGNDVGSQTADMDESEEANEGQLKSRGFWFHGKKVSLRPKTRFDMDESEEAYEGQLKSRGFWFHGKKVSLRPKTRFDMDESEEADEGSLKVNSGIGVGQKTSNIWGGRRRRRMFGFRRRFSIGR